MLHARECGFWNSTGSLWLERVPAGSLLFQKNENAWQCSVRARCVAAAAARILDTTVACRHSRVEIVKGLHA